MRALLLNVGVQFGCVAMTLQLVLAAHGNQLTLNNGISNPKIERLCTVRLIDIVNVPILPRTGYTVDRQLRCCRLFVEGLELLLGTHIHRAHRAKFLEWILNTAGHASCKRLRHKVPLKSIDYGHSLLANREGSVAKFEVLDESTQFSVTEAAF